MPGSPELIIILAVILLLFGAGRLPKLARSLGQASREFKEGIAEGGKDDSGDPASTGDSNTNGTNGANGAK